MLSLLAACSTSMAPEPSLAPRVAEGIDPRVPLPAAIPAGTADAVLVQQLDALVREARNGVASFNSRQADAERLATSAGPMASESWIVAQKALSVLVDQYGVTTRASAEIDAVAANRLNRQQWIAPADQAAIAAAAAEVSAISARQAEAIDRLTQSLAR
jgi:hypothetical protein